MRDASGAFLFILLLRHRIPFTVTTLWSCCNHHNLLLQPNVRSTCVTYVVDNHAHLIIVLLVDAQPTPHHLQILG